MLNIVADENIPLVAEAFGALGEVRSLPATAIDSAAVRAADVLLVRSVTRVDAALVAGSRLRFVGSATIGADHIDQDALASAGICFRHAPGSNAESVVEYVLAALLTLAQRAGESLRGKRVGVIGCGNIGSRLAARLPAFGAEVLRNDPPLQEQAERARRPHQYLSLPRVLAESDVITLHVPLTRTGPYPTHHLVDAAELAQLQRHAWLLSTSRGPVAANDALKHALQRGALGEAVLDVWEGEPEPDPELLALTALATPHIAGYSYDGKVAGTVMLYGALVRELGVEPRWDPETALRPGPEDRLQLCAPAASLPELAWLRALVVQLYDIEGDDSRLRALLALPRSAHAAAFRELRKRYPRRRTFSRHWLPEAELPQRWRRAVREGLLVAPEPPQ
jgi:erythronate-4-phosphate dehydrogenase